MKIDVHGHFFPKSYIQDVLKMYEGDASPVGKDVQRVMTWALEDSRMWSVERRLEDMESFGMAMQILSLSIPNVYFPDKGASVSLCQASNDMFGEMVRQHPGKFQVFASLPLHFPDEAMAELDRIGDRPEVKGIMLGANINGLPLSQPDFMPVYAELERRGIPLFIHPMRPPGLEAMTEFSLANIAGYIFDSTLAALRLVFSGVFEQHPNLTLIMPHNGGVLPIMLGRIQWGYDHVPAVREHISKPPEDFFKEFIYDTVCHDTRALRYGISLFGVDHYVFGTDFPYRDDVEFQTKVVEALALPDDQMEMIWSGNAKRVLRL